MPSRAKGLCLVLLAAALPFGVLAGAPQAPDAPDAAVAGGVFNSLKDVIGLDRTVCHTPPDGMACVPGGEAIVGSDDADRPSNEHPARKLEISTFYLDQNEVTNASYGLCAKAKRCAPLPPKAGIMEPFMGPDQPAMPIDWENARAYCAFVGKRLPTEWEWEKAARGAEGDLYPWGNEPPDCTKAIYRECAPKDCTPYPGKSDPWDCPEHATKPVGSFPKGHYGLFDLAGNGYEWTSTWATANVQACGASCVGKDPQGPCAGLAPCEGYTKKILKGGSWYWPAETLRGSWRRPEMLNTGTHRLSFRCASSTPYLTAYPPLVVGNPLPQPPLPKPLSESERQAVNEIPTDSLDAIKPCGKSGRAFLDCKDPAHYIRSNEPQIALFAPYIKNIGGGYVGVASDQNYSFIAQARSTHAWVFDYDIVVVWTHLLERAVVLASDTPKAFVEAFKGDAAAKTFVRQAVEKAFADEGERARALEIYEVYRPKLYPYFQAQLNDSPSSPGFGWLAFDENYRYIKLLFEQGRLVILKGDLLKERTMTNIGATARKLGIPIRIYYPSNAPECWPLTTQYRTNVLTLPFDEASVVLQTFSGLKIGPRQKGHWHYNVQSGLLQQLLLARGGQIAARQLPQGFIPTAQDNLTISGLPSASGGQKP